MTVYRRAPSRYRRRFAPPTGAAGAVRPSCNVSPVVSGAAVENQTLSSTTGTWVGDATITFGYQWQRDNSGGGTYSNISSATSSTYTLVAADVGCNIICVVTGTNGAGSATGQSNVLGPVSSAAGAGAWADPTGIVAAAELDITPDPTTSLTLTPEPVNLGLTLVPEPVDTPLVLTPDP